MIISMNWYWASLVTLQKIESKLDEIHIQLEKHPLGHEEWKDEFWVVKH